DERLRLAAVGRVHLAAHVVVERDTALPRAAERVDGDADPAARRVDGRAQPLGGHEVGGERAKAIGLAGQKRHAPTAAAIAAAGARVVLLEDRELHALESYATYLAAASCTRIRSVSSIIRLRALA